MKINGLIVTLAVLCIWTGCTVDKPTQDEEAGEMENTGVSNPVAYVTSVDGRYQFAKQCFDFTKPGAMSHNIVMYDKSALEEETVSGFGLAVTTSACYNLLRMAPADRTAFLEETFSREKGAGMSLVRVSIGASDFCLDDNYSWCDTPGMQNFAVHPQDEAFLFPVLREIYAINPDVKIIASPWSCPKWMKGGGYKYNGDDEVTLEQDYDSWTSGRLKPSCYDDYAEYFVRWIQTMENEGFDIHAITMQNEPLNNGNSISLYMPWRDQAKFVKVLGPALKEAGLGDVQILLFDHNFNYDDRQDEDNYPLNIYADPEAYKWADGSAWHDYGGDVSELDEIYFVNPEKSIYFTEASMGEWIGGYEARWDFNFLTTSLLRDFSKIFLGTMSRGGRGVTLWNLMLDDRRGPYSPHSGSCKTCYGGVTINSVDYKTIIKNSHWFNCAHAAAVVKPGARRMNYESFELPSEIEMLMFLNPDNTIGVLICNSSAQEQTFVFANTRFSVRYTVPATSIVSLLWQE